MTKFFATIMSALFQVLTFMLPRWKRLTVRARLYDRLQPFEVVNVGDKQLKLLIPNRTCVYWAKYGPDSEPATNAWIKSFSADDTFVDIGANIGLYSLLAAVHGVHKVIAIEPNPFSFSVLAHNIASNGVGSQIIPLCLAMNEKSSVVSFKLGSLHAGNIGNEISSDGENPGGIAITTASFSVDDLFRIQGLSGANHLKIDVDGLELEILRGATELLSDEALKSILVEDNSTNKSEESELFSFIEKFGFRQTDTWGHDETSNRIFIRE